MTKFNLFILCVAALMIFRCGTPALPVTPTVPSGTVRKTEGERLILSHPIFYWTLTLPKNWVIKSDTGFEIEANDPKEIAFMHLLSQTWLTKDRKPDARSYINYWKNSIYGDIFPIIAEGTLVSETEVSKEKFGGPYLRYDFNDSKKGIHYLQVYGSGGGPSSLVLTVWAKNADFPQFQTMLETILNSVALLPEK